MTTTSDFLRHLRTLAARQANAALSDQQLLERFLHERSETAFAALVQRHGPMVLSVCRRVLHHAQDAEDVFQATFLILARKAGSIRKGESLSSWLHGVAYHRAEHLRAKTQRRAAYERRMLPLPPSDTMDDITWRELRSVLDEELQRLPERYRAPLVLCYLEARTQDEAARRLGWSKNTFGRRMNQARQMLARRLTRRGLTLPAALTAPLLIDGAATAALPPLLAASTVRAGLAAAMGNAVSGIVSAQVVALAEGVVGPLLTKKAGTAIVLLLSLTLGIGGLLTQRIIQDHVVAEAPAMLPRIESERDAERGSRRSHAGPGKEDRPADSLQVHGVVRGPDGKPFKEAKIYCGYTKKEMKQQIVTDAEGHYRFTLRRDDVDPEGYTADPWEWTPLVAVADRYGLAWRQLGQRDKNNRLDMRLVADDAPIEGRILDLEGRPVIGATVRILRLHAAAEKDLSNFLKQWADDPRGAVTGHSIATRVMKNGDRIKLGTTPTLLYPLWWLYQTGLFPPRKTDKDGKFRITGLGRERLVELLISGPGIEETELRVVTRKDVDTKALSKPSPQYRKRGFSWPTLYGAAFELTAAPTRPITGVVRDKASGKPLAGIRILGDSPSAKVGHYFWPQHVETVTDAQGAYRLSGLPKDREYSLLVGAPEGVNYLPTAKTLLDAAGLAPLKADFALEKGVLVKGRLLDKSTGKPLAGEVYYAPLPKNPRISAQERGALHQFIIGKHFVGKEGVFKFVAYPGPGVVSAVAAKDNYRSTPFTLEEQNAGLGDRYLRVAGIPVEIQKQAHHLIDSEAKTKPLKCDLYFHPAALEKEAMERTHER